MPMVQRRGVRALQLWCSRACSPLNVPITDMTTSFRNGLAVCAIIHRYRPDLMPDFHKLRPEDVHHNNALAFKVAEEHLDIPALLDPQDMVDYEEPDKFSVITYVSQFYHLFKDQEPTLPSPSTPKKTVLSTRSSESEENDSVLHSSSSTESTPLGTPVTTKKETANRLFNRDALIAKYGPEIFSESKDDVEHPKGSNINAICRELRTKATIASER